MTLPVRHKAFLLLLSIALLGACSTSGSSGSGPTSTSPDGTRSIGCDAGPIPAGRTVHPLAVGDVQRSYIRYVPKGLEQGKPAPLIIDVTPYSPASLEEGFSGFTKPDADGRIKADDVHAVVVTPEPTNGAGALLTWNYVGTKGWSDDRAFFDQLLSRVGAIACIDPQRVLLTGFAVGGVMASIVACHESERVAVLATVSGLYDPSDCHPKRPIPVISFHGTGDQFIPFEGGVGPGAAKLGLTPETTSGLTFMATRPGAVASSTAWAAHDGCASKPTSATVSKELEHLVWPGCRSGGAVELYVIAGGQHTWPGSNGMGSVESLLGPSNDAVDATDVIWDFFLRHAPG